MPPDRAPRHAPAGAGVASRRGTGCPSVLSLRRWIPAVGRGHARRSFLALRRWSAGPEAEPHATVRGGAPDPSSLPVPSLSRRRLGMTAATLAAAWMVVAFGRQVGEASAMSARVADLRQGNAALQADVDALAGRVTEVTSSTYIAQAARAVRMGGPGEIPFTLAAGAPSLGPDAPGSERTALGGPDSAGSPLDGWLEVLFGPRG